MKNQIKLNQIRYSFRLLWVVWLLFSYDGLMAQLPSNFFTHLDIDVANLTAEQLIKFNKVQALNLYHNYEFVSVNPIESVQNNGMIAVDFLHNPCEMLIYKVRYADYEAANQYKWYGELRSFSEDCDCRNGNFILTMQAGEITARIEIDDAEFRLFDLGGGIAVLGKVRAEVYPSIACGLEDSEEETTIEQVEATSNNTCKVGLLVLYTSAAEAASPSSMNTVANDAYWQIKAALWNSNIPTSQMDVELLGVEGIPSFTETQGAIVDINRLTNDTVAQQMRNSYGADVVMVLTSANYFGVAGIATGEELILDSEHAFAIVEVSFATNAGHTFVHEFGHIFGARHNTENMGFARAKKFLTDCLEKKMTAVTSSSAGDERVILHFSNPDVYYSGTRTGIENSRDNARQLRNMACEVSEYRAHNQLVNVVPFGPIEACEGTVVHFTTYVTGPNGIYQYEWSKSLDGINWVVVGSNNDTYTFTMPANSPVFIKVKITAPNGQIASAISQVFLVEEAVFHGPPPPDYINPCYGNRVANLSTTSLTDEAIIFPNPVSEYLEITLPSLNEEIIRLTIKDMQGKQVKEKNIHLNELNNHKIRLNVSDLTEGIYFLDTNIPNFNAKIFVIQ